MCHTLVDPIGFSLENFDAIGRRRTKDGGRPVNAIDIVYDGTRIEHPAGLRGWLARYSDQFGEMVTENLGTYALSRGMEYQDRPGSISEQGEAEGRVYYEEAPIPTDVPECGRRHDGTAI
jgi:hypothetical protein